ncbi:hypothetical protein KXW47_007498, partial [Aspergillus fumigatus]
GGRSNTQSGETPGAPSAKKTFPIGLKLLHEPSEPALVDVIFIHGLTGDRERTWTAKGQIEPWPKTLLPTVLPKARVLAFGYDAYVTGLLDLVSKNRIGNHAKDLLGKLAIYRGRDDTENRPIFFVCHSLGGLVCIDALAMSNASPQPHLKNIVDCTRGVMFLGTPHSGSAMATWAERLATAINLVHETNPKILEVLKQDSEVLERIQGSFYDMIGTREALQLPKISIICFFEQLPLRFVGESQVVSKYSAILPQYESIGIHANHMDMTKFSDEHDDGFVNISGKLLLWAKALATIPKPGPQPSPARPRPILKHEREEMSPKEASARHYAAEVLLEGDDEANLTVSLPTRLLEDDSEHRVRFITPSQLAVLRSSWSRLLTYYQPFPASMESIADPRRQRYSLSFAPWLNGVFLARVPCTDVWRILSGSVSERQHSSDAVLVNRFMFSISPTRYEGSTVLIASYRPNDGHCNLSTVLPSKELAEAIVGSGGLPPTDTLGPNFVCSEGGYEKVQMPYALFLTVLPLNKCVLFKCQMDLALSLLDIMLPMLDCAWDHDDAYECGPDDVPIKIRVEALQVIPERLASMRHFTSGDPPNRTAFDLRTMILQKECKKYFEEHRDPVEIEDIL